VQRCGRVHAVPTPIQGHAQPAEGVRAIALDSPSAVAAACASMGGRVAQECTHLARGASATLANEPAPGVTSRHARRARSAPRGSARLRRVLDALLRPRAFARG